jgi:DNA-binding NtrC family response regulator
MVLESAGWQVVPAMETDEALRRFQEHGFDVVVLGHSIPSSERICLAQTMKSIRSNVPIVMVCIQGDNTFSTKFADARVGSLDGPVVLINAIRRLTERANKKEHS